MATQRMALAIAFLAFLCLSASAADPCQGKDEAACDAAVGTCVWCVSAAVPSSCFLLVSCAAAVALAAARRCGAHTTPWPVPGGPS